jgi:hypothetical protein
VPATALSFREVGQTWSFRGSKSRNKVTVGEPAVGSLEKLDVQLVQLKNSPSRPSWFAYTHRLLARVFLLDELGSHHIALRYMLSMVASNSYVQRLGLVGSTRFYYLMSKTISHSTIFKFV